MNNEPDELIELLRNAREYTKFVSEMGVDTVDDPSATSESSLDARRTICAFVAICSFIDFTTDRKLGEQSAPKHRESARSAS